MQTGNTKHENHACLKVEKMVARLLGYNALSIQAADSNDTLQIVANGQPYKLHELGSGIAQCILVLVNAAVAKPGYILIDEPELDLHPSLQLDFLTALADFAEYGTLFSTHSIGLARAAAQRIYSVTRQDGFSQVKELEELQNLPEFLGSLSYSSYHALGFDKVLLVEGTTEVLAIQRLLRKLGKDHRVLLLPLGGSSMINGSREPELNEIKRITPNVSALIDSELVSSNDSLAPDRAAFLTACGKLGITCRVLERRALENYLTDAAIKQVKGPKFRALTKFEKLTDVKPFWGKNENWRIIGEMSWDDVKATDLGQFLESL
jgi:AAA domain, putative AbiEii toxin, Type IV TA system